jgi:hypothetical protein
MRWCFSYSSVYDSLSARCVVPVLRESIGEVYYIQRKIITSKNRYGVKSVRYKLESIRSISLDWTKTLTEGSQQNANITEVNEPGEYCSVWSYLGVRKHLMSHNIEPI